jgi:hypothetical protein
MTHNQTLEERCRCIAVAEQWRHGFVNTVDEAIDAIIQSIKDGDDPRQPAPHEQVQLS